MFTDDFGDRTQPATERRRRDARLRGQVARSSDLVTSVVLLAAAICFWWMAPRVSAEFGDILKSGISSTSTQPITGDQVATQIRLLAGRAATALLPVLLAIVTAAVTSSLLQTGWLWSSASILPKMERISPTRGLMRFGSMQTWVTGVWSIIKIVVLMGVLVGFVHSRLSSAGPLAQGTPTAILQTTTTLIAELGIALSLALVVLAVIDYGYQFWQHERQLMMTVEEVRRELREDEGNPQQNRQLRDRMAAAAAGAASASAVRPV